MNTNVVNVAIVDGKTITQATELRANPQGQPVRIKAVANGKYVLAEGDKGLAPENITVKRVGKDLHVALEGTDPDQPQLIIEGFFDAQGQLVGVAEDGAYHAYITSDAEQDHEAAFLMDGVSSPQVLGSEELGGFDGLTAATTGMGWFWPALLGLGALAVGGAAWASNRDGGDDDYHDPMMPPTPQLGEVEDNTGDVQAPIENGGSTDDTTPTFSGTGTPGNTIIFKDGDKVLGEAVVGSDGKWEFTPETPLAEGEHTIVIVEKDPAGNESLPSPGFELIVDTVAPGQPEIKEVLDDIGAIQGAIAQNGVTDDNTPTLNGTAEPGSTVEVFANGEKIGSTLVDADSNWSFTPDTALADGEYSFTTVAVDPAGNRGMPSLPYDLIIDTRGELIKIDHVMDDQGSIIGELQNGGVTDDTTPTLSGQATPGTQVNIYDKGVLIGTAPVDASGQWTFTPDTPLGEGQHGFTTTVVTPAHGESEPTPVFDLEIDTTGPGKPGDNGNGGIDLVADNVGLIQGPVADGGYTDDSTPTLSGGGQEPGDTVTIKDNGTIIGTAPVDENGNWVFTPNPPLNDGDHELTLIVTDPAGNESEESDPYTVIVDTQKPLQPEITGVIDDQGNVTGPINAGDVTDDAQPEIKGKAEPGSTVIIYDNGVEIGRAPVDGAGDWTFTPSPPLTNGAHDLSAKTEDAAGNISDPSDPFGFELIAGGTPPAPAITGILDDVGSKQGNISPGGVTDDARPTINGTGEPGSIVSVYADGVLIGTSIVAANGQWSVTPTKDLPENLNNITATTTNAALNVSPETGQYPIIVDTSAPAAASGETLTDDVGPIIGQINDNDTTDDNTPTVSGTAEPGTTAIIYDKGVEIGRAPVDASGNWSFTPSTPLADGDHSFHSVIEDAAANQSPPSPTTDFTVDTRLVEISITQIIDDEGTVTGPISPGGVTNDTTPTINGQATPNSVVNIYDKGVLIGTANSDTNGKWTYTPPTALAEGDHSITAAVVTPAGGESPHTSPFELDIDITAPGKPGESGNGGIDEVTDDVGSLQGPIADGGQTDDTTPTLSGGGQEPGDTVTIKDNGTIIGTAPVDKDGNWAFTPNPPLNDGEHKFTLIVTDPAGNPSEESAPYTIVVDTTAPAAKAIVESIGKDSGTLGDFLTNDGSAGRLISGSLTAALATGEKVQVSLDGGITWLDAILNGPDSWSFVDVSSHTSDWEIRTRVVDAAGNVNASGQDVTLDTTAPDAPTSIIVRTDSVDVEFDGSNLSVGDSISLAIGEQRFDYTLTQADIDAGKAAITVPTELQPLSEYGVSAAVVDAAGNNSQYISISVGATTEDFTSVTDSKVYTEGQTLSLSTMDVKVLQGQTFVGIYSNTPGYGEGKRLYFGYSAWDMLEITPKTPCTAMSFTTDYVHNVASYTFYDTNGNMLISLNYPGKPEGYEVSYTAPPGVLIGKVVAWTDEWGFLDNFKFERPDSFEWHDTPSEQTVGGEAFGAHYGSSGDDTFSLADAAGFASGAAGEIHGGAGIDTLKLTGQDQILDLTKLAEKVSSVEIVDLTGIGNNTLNLSLGDILEQGGTSLFIDDDHMQMMVKGNAGDVVNLDGLMADGSDPGNWATQGQVTVGGVVYEVYRHDALDAELLVQQGVQTNLV